MSFSHSNVIPSFKCHSVIPKSLHVLQNWNLVVCHSRVIPCRNDFGMTYLSVLGHSQIEWFGMTIALIPLEWQGWPWNDWTGPRMTGWGGLRRGHSNFHPCHSCPIPSFRRHPGMQFQWGWASNDGGMSPAEGPKLVTFPLSNHWTLLWDNRQCCLSRQCKHKRFRVLSLKWTLTFRMYVLKISFNSLTISQWPLFIFPYLQVCPVEEQGRWHCIFLRAGSTKHCQRHNGPRVLTL